MFEILIFQFYEQAFGFLGIIHFHKSRFPFFWSNTSMCNGFCSSLSLFILRFTFIELFKQRKNKNKRVGRYIGTSLCKSHDQQNH